MHPVVLQRKKNAKSDVLGYKTIILVEPVAFSDDNKGFYALCDGAFDCVHENDILDPDVYTAGLYQAS